MGSDAGPPHRRIVRRLYTQTETNGANISKVDIEIFSARCAFCADICHARRAAAVKHVSPAT